MRVRPPRRATWLALLLGLLVSALAELSCAYSERLEDDSLDSSLSSCASSLSDPKASCAVDWQPVDDARVAAAEDGSLDWIPVRALDADGSSSGHRAACKDIRIKSKQSVNVLDAHKLVSSSVVWVATNGESKGWLFEGYVPGCEGTLAFEAYKLLRPYEFDMDPKRHCFLYSPGGFPIRPSHPTDLSRTRTSSMVYLLLSKETWVWPVFRVGFNFTMSGVRATSVSDNPRVFLLHDLVSDAVGKGLITRYEPRMVASPQKHYSKGFEDHRTSLSGWIDTSKDEDARQLQLHMQRILRYPVLEFVEEPQFLKYGVGQRYRHHHDFFHTFTLDPFHVVMEWLREVTCDLVERDAFLQSPWSKAVRSRVQENPRRYQPLACGQSCPILSAVMWFPAAASRSYHAKLRDAICGLTKKCKGSDAQYFGLSAGNIVEVVRSLADLLAKELEVETADGSPNPYVMNQFHASVSLARAKQIEPNRHATILPYLNDVEEGGETVFPKAADPKAYLGSNFTYPQRAGMTECSRGLLIKPVKGGAALFYHRAGDGSFNVASEHGGCPPVRGVKYAINGFTWSVPYLHGIEHYGL